MKGKKPQKQLLQFVMLSLLSVVSVLVMTNESYAALACNACHGTSGDMRPLDAVTRDVSTGGFVGSHRAHMAPTAAAPADCNVCHTNAAKTTTFTSSHRDGGIQISAGVTYNKGVFFNQTSVPVLGTCATASCHIAATDLVKATPTWGTASTCNSCHDATPSTGSHSKHLGSAYQLPVCADCHTGAVAGSSGGDNHMTGTISVASGLGYPTSTAKHASGTYTATSCSTSYCHSSGQAANGTAGLPVYAPTSPQWGVAASGACGTCHTITGRTTGRHSIHILSNDDCGKCHTGSSATAYASTNHVNSSIDVTAGLGYTAGGAPGNGYGTCSAASCHAPFTNIAPKVTRSWTNGGISCTACHENPQQSGAHNKHYVLTAIAGNCDYCHTSSGDMTHADGFVNVNFIAAPIAKHASTTYTETCTTACHAVYGATGASPVWNVSGAGCASCHLTAIPATGLHTKHLAATGGTCSSCHAAGYTATAANVTDHSNGTVQVVGQGYPVNVTKHAVGAPNYFTCSTATCHDAYGTTGVSANWNTAPTTTSCATCHAAVPVTGSHTKHLTRTTINCASCHIGATTLVSGGTKHIDGMINVSSAGGGHLKSVAKHAANSGYMSCAATCHNGGNGAVGKFTAPNATWGAGLDCAGCHGYPPANTNHTGVLAATVGACNSCHDTVKDTTIISTNSTTAFNDLQSHMNGSVQGGKCDACHGYPPVQSMAGMGINANYSTAKLQNYSGGGGAHSVAGHLALTLKTSNGGSFAGCLTCHPSDQHNGGSGTFLVAQVQVKVPNKYKFNSATSITYDRTGGAGSKTTGTCSNVSCHFQKTPVWSTQTFTQGH